MEQAEAGKVDPVEQAAAPAAGKAEAAVALLTGINISNQSLHFPCILVYI